MLRMQIPSLTLCLALCMVIPDPDGPRAYAYHAPLPALSEDSRTSAALQRLDIGLDHDILRQQPGCLAANADCLLQSAIEDLQMAPEPKAWHMHSIALAHAASGRAAKAFRWVENIPAGAEDTGARERRSALHSVASVLARLGDEESALQAVYELSDILPRTHALLAVGVAIAESPDSPRGIALMQEASRLATSIKEGLERDKTRNEIAMANAKVGRLRDATDQMSLVRSIRVRHQGLHALVQDELAAGDFEQAILVADNIGDPAERGVALCTIAAAQVAAGDKTAAWISLLRAMRIAMNLAPSLHLVRLLSSISIVEFELSDTPMAELSLSWAAVVAGDLESANDRSAGFASIAVARFRMGDSHNALQTVDRYLYGSSKANALGSMDLAVYEDALVRARAGEHAEALSRAARIRSLHTRAIAFGAIASAQANAGDEAGGRETFSKALDVIMELENARVRDIFIAMVAGIHAQAGYLAQALRLAAGNESARSIAYNQVFRGVRNAITSGNGRLWDMTGALVAARSIRAKSTRASMLACISALLAASAVPEALPSE